MYPRSDITQLYPSWENGGRGVNVCENKVKSEESGLGWYIRNNINHYWLESTSRTTTHEETVDPKEFKKTKKEQRKMNEL